MASASNRSIRRAKEREAKKLEKKAMSKLQKAITSTPEQCDECGAPFDKTDSSVLNEWRIAVYDDGPIHLVCPACVPIDVKNKTK